MILLSITILIYISSLEFLWVPIMIFSSGYQPIYCAFPPYCALLCHNYSRLFYYTFNISSLLFRLIFYPSVNLRSVRLNIGSDKLQSFRLIFGNYCGCAFWLKSYLTKIFVTWFAAPHGFYISSLTPSILILAI